jgi:hypothetical protein
MKSNILNRAFFFAGVFLLTIFLSCSKHNNNEPQPDIVVKEKPETSVKSDSNVLLPGQTITFELTSTSALKDTLNATVNGKSFVLYKIEGNKYGGTLPVIPEGTHNVSIPSLALKTPVTVSIAAYTPITDPKAVIESFEKSLSENIDSLVAFNEESHSIDIEFIKSLQSQIQAMEKNLTASERIEMAYAIKALNLQTGGGLNPLSFSGNYNFPAQQVLAYPYTTFERPKTITELDPGDKLVIIGKQMVKLTIIALAAEPVVIASIAGMLVIPGPYKAIPALTTAISITTYIIARDYAAAQAERIGKLEGIAEYIFDYPTQTTNKLKVFSITNAVAPALTFKAGIEKPISVPVTFRNITTQDAQNPSTLVKDVVNGDNDLLSADKKVETDYNGIVKYLPLVKAYKKYFLRLPAVAKNENKNAPAANLSVTKVSDPEIKLNVTKDGELLKITATSSTVKSAKDFTFDVTYKNDDLNITLSKTFSAIYDGTIYPETIALVSGNNQIGQPGKTLTNPFIVKVTDKDGKVIQNINIDWNVSQGDGKLSAAQTPTNAAGIAQVSFETGKAEKQEVTASAKKPDGTLLKGAPIKFTASTVVDSIPIYTKMLAGTWKHITPPSSSSPNGNVDEFEINEYGVGRRSKGTNADGSITVIPVGDSRNGLSFNVFKALSGGYYCNIEYGSLNLKYRFYPQKIEPAEYQVTDLNNTSFPKTILKRVN